jgi:hypothetical protein
MVIFTLWPLYTWEKVMGEYWTGDWVGLTAGRKMEENKIIPAPTRNITTVLQPIALSLSYATSKM